MSYAAILKAEEGWRAVMAREDGTPIFVPISFWGVVVEMGRGAGSWEQEDRRFVIPTQYVPLDDMQEQLSSKQVFVMILSPNEEELIPARNNDIKNRCLAKAKHLKKV